MVVFSDLKNISAEEVYTNGRLVAADGELIQEGFWAASVSCPSAMNVKAGSMDFAIPAEKNHVRVIELVPEQIITRQAVHKAKIENGLVISDASRDILKIAVVERHKGTGNIGKAFVSGFGLKSGAIAGSVAHDSHNIIVVGTCDEDMMTAVERIIEMNGGLATACDGKVTAELPLPIAGLMSVEPLEIVRNQMDAMINAACAMGASVGDPFMILSFLALPVIPELKLTDRGLFDVNQFKHVSLFVD
jgi:adenine deaminase